MPHTQRSLSRLLDDGYSESEAAIISSWFVEDLSGQDINIKLVMLNSPPRYEEQEVATMANTAENFIRMIHHTSKAYTAEVCGKISRQIRTLDGDIQPYRKCATLNLRLLAELYGKGFRDQNDGCLSLRQIVAIIRDIVYDPTRIWASQLQCLRCNTEIEDGVNTGCRSTMGLQLRRIIDDAIENVPIICPMCFREGGWYDKECRHYGTGFYCNDQQAE